MNLYEALEAATAEQAGIYAVCTAEAISNLWNWKSEEDLYKATEAIRYMIKKMEGIK